MRRLLPLLALTACASEPSPTTVYAFGPYTVQPAQEVTTQCVAITLHNDAPLFVNSVELTTGAGFHHSNWFYVPEHSYAGDDGTFTCDDRAFDQVAAAILGGVLYAQSTQAPHEVQAFPPGVAIQVPAHSKIVAQIHLLNAGDSVLELHPTIALTTLPGSTVTTQLAAMSFEDHALALPPHASSRFATQCDLAPKHQALLGRDPDFHIYYALAHYHALGTGLTIEAVRPDGTADTVYTTAARVGDVLGGTLAPAFSMAGYTGLRMSCDFQNPRDTVVHWGYGDQEMCVFLAFTDSPYVWGGAVDSSDPGTPVDNGGVASFFTPCTVIAADAQH